MKNRHNSNSTTMTIFWDLGKFVSNQKIKKNWERACYCCGVVILRTLKQILTNGKRREKDRDGFLFRDWRRWREKSTHFQSLNEWEITKCGCGENLSKDTNTHKRRVLNTAEASTTGGFPTYAVAEIKKGVPPRKPRQNETLRFPFLIGSEHVVIGDNGQDVTNELRWN